MSVVLKSQSCCRVGSKWIQGCDSRAYLLCRKPNQKMTLPSKRAMRTLTFQPRWQFWECWKKKKKTQYHIYGLTTICMHICTSILGLSASHSGKSSISPCQWMNYLACFDVSARNGCTCLDRTIIASTNTVLYSCTDIHTSICMHTCTCVLGLFTSDRKIQYYSLSICEIKHNCSRIVWLAILHANAKLLER